MRSTPEGGIREGARADITALCALSGPPFGGGFAGYPAPISLHTLRSTEGELLRYRGPGGPDAARCAPQPSRRPSTMVHQVQGVVSRVKDAPVELTTVLVPDPGPGEAVVKVQACGVCHTDLHYKLGGIGNDYPYLLGHEAAGVVESVVTGSPTSRRRLRGPELAGRLRTVPGLSPRPPLVLLQHPQRDAEDDPGGRHSALPRPRHRRVRREDAGGSRAVHEGGPRVPPQVAGLLGCGVMAGIGAAINTGGSPAATRSP